VSCERGEIGTDVAMQFRATVNATDSTGCKHPDANTSRKRKRCRHGGSAERPAFADRHRQVAFGNLSCCTKDASMFVLCDSHSRHAIEHCSDCWNCTMGSNRSNATLKGFTVGG
jgi:hypothetical protein